MTAFDWDSTTNVAYYSQLVQELLKFAAEARSAETRAQMMVLAAQYEELARHATTKRNARDHGDASEEAPPGPPNKQPSQKAE